MAAVPSPLKRYEGNPILTPEQMPFPCYTVFNAGATMFEGRFLLVLRVEDLRRRTDFYVATSEDGFHFDVSPEPIIYPLRPIEERYGSHRFDMRITQMDGTYYCYHAMWLGPLHCTIGLATTEDFVHFEPRPGSSVASNRNAVLFPEKINGMYARLERPELPGNGSRIWYSESPDLEFWGRSRPLDMPSLAWASQKSGAGAIPIKTDRGWLEIYHGVCTTCSSNNYHLGAMLVELEDPSKIVAAPESYVLAAIEDYECMGQTPNVVFTSGAVTTDDGTIYVYYGCADHRMAVATCTVDELVDFCLTAD
jgi:beta-1,4-mannooligosaccharide/beta-1,4-mannosyl-N-acetylglucosamine phosphorylase